jgi:hypothetical protein
LVPYFITLLLIKVLQYIMELEFGQFSDSKKEQIQINIEKEENKSQKQNKKVLKKSLLKPTFETNGNMENIHDDLILSIDICEKSNLIVTGR